jgi:IS5 family transposase
MRKLRNQQLPLIQATADHPKAKEYARISEILDSNYSIYELTLQDFDPGDKNVGANGMTAEQVIRAAIVKQIEGYSYRELAFHLYDSLVFRQFCKIGYKKPFKKSTLQQGIKSISAETWEAVNRVLICYAGEKNIEKGRKIRVDCTVVESNIHAPYDSELLVDSVRVLARVLSLIKIEVPGLIFSFADHLRRAKRRNLNILHAKNGDERKRFYRDLINVTESTIGYGENGLKCIGNYRGKTLEEIAVVAFAAEQIKHYLPLARQVICQTRRRVIGGESVPATEKIVSIFEAHTDIIRKDRRDTYYGHKICVTGGASNLILDCVVLEGNPADSDLTGMMLERQGNIYGRAPLKAAFDGGFCSHLNLKAAKVKGIKDVCFSKGRGLAENVMCRSKAVYKKLRNFRAGIESSISWLKRSLGLTRCTWKGYGAFKSYVWASIVAANLLTISRKQLN